MGSIINFPVAQRRAARAEAGTADMPGRVIILPVIRIERAALATPGQFEPGNRSTSGRKRRRRASRS